MSNWSYTIKEGEHKGETLWSGRYTAAVAIVLLKRNNKLYALINKRGSGTPNKDMIGKYNFTCGFMEDDEFGTQTCQREVKEECGYLVSSKNFKLFGVSTDPSDSNVSIRYVALLTEKPKKIEATGGEKDEVADVKWIDLKEYEKIDWAFNHKKLAKQVYQCFR